MRLIDADALKEEMDMEWCPDIAVSEIWNVIDKAPTVGGWTSVKDKMPELKGDYLVTDGYHVPWKCRLLKLADVKGWVNGASNPVINYWMPLPEPPKEGELE